VTSTGRGKLPANAPSPRPTEPEVMAITVASSPLHAHPRHAPRRGRLDRHLRGCDANNLAGATGSASIPVVRSCASIWPGVGPTLSTLSHLSSASWPQYVFDGCVGNDLQYQRYQSSAEPSPMEHHRHRRRSHTRLVATLRCVDIQLAGQSAFVAHACDDPQMIQPFMDGAFLSRRLSAPPCSTPYPSYCGMWERCYTRQNSLSL
jgi:hypothetical protein